MQGHLAQAGFNSVLVFKDVQRTAPIKICRNYTAGNVPGGSMASAVGVRNLLRCLQIPRHPTVQLWLCLHGPQDAETKPSAIEPLTGPRTPDEQQSIKHRHRIKLGALKINLDQINHIHPTIYQINLHGGYYQ